MNKLTLLMCLFFALVVLSLPAQTVSRIELLQGLSLPQAYDYVTTWSDSLLHFYRIEHTDNTFIVKHWVCTSEGVLTTPINLFWYSSVQSWGTDFPSHADYEKKYGNLYISFTVLDNYHLIRITEAGQVTHDILPANGYPGYTLFTTDYLYYSETIGNYPDLICSIYRYSLNTHSTDSLFVYPYYDPYFSIIDNRYLLIHTFYGENNNTCVLIDTLQVVHPCNATGIPYIDMINMHSSEILPDTYLVGIEDGLLRDYSFGVLTINNYNLNFTPCGGIIYMMEQFYGQIFNDVIPYGNGRFSCIEGFTGIGTLSYRNYTYNGDTFTEDTDFPNLSPNSDSYSLQKINDRYAVAIAGPQTGPRNFICIDYENQAVTDTVFTLTNATNIAYGALLADSDKLYYVYNSSNSARYLYILKIVEYTANSDPVQPPQTLSARAYPNPFYDNAKINVTLEQPEAVSVSIYNLKGQLVKTLPASGKIGTEQEFDWDGTTQSGTKAAPGLYILKAITPSGPSISRKLMLLK